jgi:hypothetical protein
VKLFKKILRTIGLGLMILLASVGVGLMGAILPEQKTSMKKEDTIEMADTEGKKEKE